MFAAAWFAHIFHRAVLNDQSAARSEQSFRFGECFRWVRQMVNEGFLENHVVGTTR